MVKTSETLSWHNVSKKVEEVQMFGRLRVKIVLALIWLSPG